MAHRLGIERVDAEVVHRIPVHRAQLDLLVVEEDRLGHHRARVHHVAVGQDQAPLGVDDEPGALAHARVFGVEVAGGGDPDGDDPLDHFVEGVLPARRLGGVGGEEGSEESEGVQHGRPLTSGGRPTPHSDSGVSRGPSNRTRTFAVEAIASPFASAGYHRQRRMAFSAKGA